MDSAVAFVGPILSAIACILIAGCTQQYFAETLPYLIKEFGVPHAAFTTMIGFFLLGNLVFNYVMAMRTSPGEPPEHFTAETLALLSADPEKREGEPHRFCRKCNKVKPMRAHHCSICKKCVLKMDHHCPWINNCVGYRNYRYFLLFLIYLFAACAFYIFVGAEPIISAVTGHPTSGPFLICSIICISAAISSGMFITWNAYLLMTNQSTIELYQSWMYPNRNKLFDLGVVENLKEVFGDRPLSRALLPSKCPPRGDGICLR